MTTEHVIVNRRRDADGVYQVTKTYGPYPDEATAEAANERGWPMPEHNLVQPLPEYTLGQPLHLPIAMTPEGDDGCRWYCTICVRCHANACPSLWGGDPEVPCAHEGNMGAPVSG